MATLVRTGRYYSGGTPGVAHVAAAMQWAYAADTESGSQTVIWHTIGSRLGTVVGVGSVTYQLAAMAVQSGQGSGGTRDVPGSVLARTGNHSVSATMDYGGAGVTVRHPLTSIITSPRNRRFAFAAASRNNSLAVGMVPAASISGSHNTWMYSRSAPNGVVQAGPGSGSNQGHMAVWMEGDINEAPTAPTNTLPSSGTYGTTLTPNISGNFNDENKKLSDGRNWDYAWQARIEVRDGTSVIWDYTYTTSSTERSNHRTIRRYAGPALKYYTTYSYRIRHRDRTGAWGPPSAWVYFSIRHNNRTPNAPRNFSGLGTINGTRTVTVGSTFTDPDYPTLPNGQTYERIQQKQIRVRRVSDNALVYDSGVVNTTSSERNNARTSTSWTLPAWNVTYRWYERHRDRAGAWSAYASGTVTAHSGGSMDPPTSPSGRITNFTNPGNVSAVYRNTANLNATSVQFGLTTKGLGWNHEVKTFSGISLARNTAFTKTWSETFQRTLSPGVEYQVWARAYVPNVGWTDHAHTSLTTNATPNTPVRYQPNDGWVGAVVPVTGVRATDPDQHVDDLTVTAEIYDADTDDLVDTYELPQAQSGWNVFRTSPAGIPYGDYKWRAQSNDGYLSSPWSGMWSFTYAAVPDVTITAPSETVITTSQPVLAWSSTDQTAWRVIGRDVDNAVVYDTGARSGGEQSHIISDAQHWIGGERWNNHETFHWAVRVQDSSTLWGESYDLELTLEYIAPEPLIVDSVSEMAFHGAEGTHYTVITTSEATFEESYEFLRYIVDRVEIDGPAGNEIEGTLRREHFISGMHTDTSFADFDMTSNQWYRWSFRYEVQSGVDVIESDPVYAESVISFHGTLLHMPFDPLGSYAWLPFGTEHYEPEVTWHQGHSEVMTTNGRAPHGYSDSSDYVEWRCTSTLVPREDATVEQQRDALRKLWKYQNARFAPNGRPNAVCFREGRGGDDSRVYGRITQPRRVHSYTRLYTVEFEFRELEAMPAEGGVQ